MYLPDLHQEFLNYLEIERNYSPRTIIAYRSDFQSFTKYLGIARLEPVGGNVTRSTIRGYIAYLRGSGLAPASVARHIHSLHSFWNYLRDEGYVQTDPFSRISLPKLPRKLPQVLSADEARRLLQGAEQQGCVFNAFRDKAILSLLILGGLRRSEILQLRLSDLDLNSNTLHIRSSKGGNSRLIPLGEEASAALQDWLELRSQDCGHEFLFTCKWGAPLSKNGLSSCLKRALSQAGIQREGLTLHTLRHTFATLMLRGGCDLYVLQQLLGHSRLDTTAVYLHTGLADLRQAIKHHPLNIHRGVGEGDDS